MGCEMRAVAAGGAVKGCSDDAPLIRESRGVAVGTFTAVEVEREVEEGERAVTKAGLVPL